MFRSSSLPACLFVGVCALIGSVMMGHLIGIWTFVRCVAGEWILRNVVHIFPRATFQRRACKKAYRTYIETVDEREKELGGFDP
jgi:hypothetical protein